MGRQLTVEEVAEQIRMSDQFVYTLIHSGRLAASKFGNRYRIDQGAVEQLLADHRTSQSANVIPLPGPTAKARRGVRRFAS